MNLVSHTCQSGGGAGYFRIQPIPAERTRFPPIVKGNTVSQSCAERESGR